jgi:fructose-1,6-bisphosphatase/inositol monophosphatase family enzyme
MNIKAIKAYNNAVVEEITKRVNELLKENKMAYDFTVNSDGFIEITVENGDWKHDHLALKHIMREAGYISFGRHIPESQENGDDSFTAIYLYR